MSGPLTGISMVSFTSWNPVPSSPPYRPPTQRFSPCFSTSVPTSHELSSLPFSSSQWTFSWPTPCYPHWPAKAGHTTLCVQGIFGSGKTYSASLLLVVLSSILDINCVLTAEPNLPLATAIEIIDILLQDASKLIRDQYARCLANQVKSSSPLDCTPEDRSQLLRNDSSLRCLLITQGSLLRDLCREHPAFQTFLTTCKVAINDEAQQGGQAGSTILASFLDRRCLQLLIGDKEQTRSGTGGEPIPRKPSSPNSP